MAEWQETGVVRGWLEGEGDGEEERKVAEDVLGFWAKKLSTCPKKFSFVCFNRS